MINKSFDDRVVTTNARYLLSARIEASSVVLSFVSLFNSVKVEEQVLSLHHAEEIRVYSDELLHTLAILVFLADRTEIYFVRSLVSFTLNDT